MRVDGSMRGDEVGAVDDDPEEMAPSVTPMPRRPSSAEHFPKLKPSP